MTETAAKRATRALSVATFLGLSGFSILRFLTFKAHIHDLGLISQSLFALRRGELLTNSINPLFGMPASYLGNHFSPSMVVFGPVLWLAGSPLALLITQAAILALAPLVLMRIARRRLDPAGALAVTVAYVVHPGFWTAGLYDFHQETCIVTLGLVAWDLFEEGRMRPLIALLIFITGLKEETALWVAGFGLVMAIRGRKREGVIVAVAAMAWFFLVMLVLMPALSPSGSISQIARRFGYLGTTPIQVLMTILTRPWVPVLFVCSPRHLKYLIDLTAPWLFLPLMAPTTLLVPAGVLALHLLSSLEISYDIGFYHHDSTLPFLAIAALEALSRLRPCTVRRLAPILVANAFFWHAIAQSAYLPGQHVPLSPWAVHEDYAYTDHHRRLDAIRARVTPDSPLVTSAFLACFFTDRPFLAPFPRGLDRAKQVLVDLTNPYAHRHEAARFWLEWALQEPRGGAATVVAALEKLSRDRSMGLIAADDGYYLFERGARDALPRDGFITRIAGIRTAWLALRGRGYSMHP